MNSFRGILAIAVLFTAGFTFDARRIRKDRRGYGNPPPIAPSTPGVIPGTQAVPPQGMGAQLAPPPGLGKGRTLISGENSITPGKALVVRFNANATANFALVYESGTASANTFSLLNAGDTYTIRRPIDGSGCRAIKGSAADANVALEEIPDGPYPFFRSGYLGNVQVIYPGTEISSVEQNGHVYYIMPAAPGSEATWNVNLGGGALADSSFKGMGPWGGVPAPSAGNVTLPATWSAIRLTTPATSANSQTFIRVRFEDLVFTSPITTAQASVITVSAGGFIWGSSSEGVVFDHVAGVDLGFPLTRATGEGMEAISYRHLTTFGGTTEASPGSGTTYTAGLTGTASVSILCTNTGVAITVVGPNGTGTLVSAASAMAGNTFTPTYNVQKGGVYTITNGTYNAGGTTTAGVSPTFCTPQFFVLTDPIVECQFFTSLIFSLEGGFIGGLNAQADMNGLTLGSITIDRGRFLSQDVYKTDAIVDAECAGATVGWKVKVRDTEYHNCKMAGTNFDQFQMVRCRQVFNLTGAAAQGFRTYLTTVTQGFGSLLIQDCEFIQVGSSLGAGDSTLCINIPGDTGVGSTPFHADEIRIEGCHFILNGNATGSALTSAISIDPSNAAAQPVDRIIIKNLRYSYSAKTPASTKPFMTIGYGGATGGAYTTTTLDIDGIIAYGAAAANGNYPQTFGGAQSTNFLSLNPDANTVTITSFGYRNWDATAITSPTAFILYGANTTVTNYKGVHSLYPNLDTLLTVNLASAPATFTYTHGVTTGASGPLPQGPGFLVVTGGTTSNISKNGLQFSGTDAAALSPSCEVDMGDTVAITYSANTVAIKVKGVNR